MSASLDEFKQFIKKHPLLKQEVLSKRKTWQELYEEYVLLGEEEFESYKKEEQKTEKKEETPKKQTPNIVIK